MEGEHLIFTPQTAQSLVLLSLGAFAIPLVCRPLRLPAAVGEIMFGMVVGPHLLGWVATSDFIHLLGHLGFFLLMFIAGFELNFRKLEQGGAPLLLRGLLLTGLMFAFAFGAVLVAGWPPFLGMVLAAISIGVPLVLLQETGLGRADFGQHVLLVGSIGEFAGILLATGVNAYAHAGGLNTQLFNELLALGSVFLLAYAMLVIFRTLVWWRSESFARVVESHDPSELGVRAGLALMFIFVAVASTLRIDPILGAFLAGALFSFVFRHKGPLEVKFMSIGNGFFVPFFFITVGLDFNLRLALEGDISLFFKMLVLLFVIRLLGFALVRGPGFGFRHSVAAALVLSAPLTLLVVIGNLGLHLEFIDQAFHSTVILLAVFSSTVYPFFFKLVARGLARTDDKGAAHA